MYCAFLLQLIGTLVDCSTSIRGTARSVLQLTRLENSAMFKLCFEGLVKNLELYSQVLILCSASFFMPKSNNSVNYSQLE